MANVNNFWQNLTKFNDSIQNFESFYDKIQFNRLFNIIFSAKFNSKIDSKLWNWLHSIQQNIHSIRKRRYRSGLSRIAFHTKLDPASPGKFSHRRHFLQQPPLLFSVVKWSYRAPVLANQPTHPTVAPPKTTSRNFFLFQKLQLQTIFSYKTASSTKTFTNMS